MAHSFIAEVWGEILGVAEGADAPAYLAAIKADLAKERNGVLLMTGHQVSLAVFMATIRGFLERPTLEPTPTLALKLP